MLVSVFMERHFWERVFGLLPVIEKRPLLEVVLQYLYYNDGNFNCSRVCERK